MSKKGRRKGVFTKFEKLCEYCHKSFIASYSAARFCSMSCAGKWQQTFNKPIRKGWIDFECEQCHKIFQDWRAQIGKRRFCNRECLYDFYAQLSRIEKRPGQESGMCKICQKEFFYYSSARPNAQYCSDQCRQIDHPQKVNGYNSGSWDPNRNTKTSGAIGKKYLGDVCAICGWKETTCDVHHIISRKNGGDNKLENLIVLCPNHHRMVEKKLITQESLQSIWTEKYGHLKLEKPFIY